MNNITKAALLAAWLVGGTIGTQAVQHVISVNGTDAIFLAGRTDVSIPEPDQPWSVLLRHGFPTPEEAKETFPSFISVNAGDVVKVFDPAVGGINFFNGSFGGLFGPEGNIASSSLSALGGISGYLGTQGPLVGVFLNNNIPLSSPPPTLDFSNSAARDFTSISPLLGQIFFIGDGQTSGGTLQQFIAPADATPLFSGIPDVFGFGGAPGPYDYNDGSYRITVGVNEEPPRSVPEAGSSLALLGIGLAALASIRSRRS